MLIFRGRKRLISSKEMRFRGDRPMKESDRSFREELRRRQ